MDDIAIKVDHISKVFKLPHEKSTSLKSKLINLSNKGFEIQKAIEDLSFEVKKGEFFGIVGRNGSGKSTLLKLLAGIYEPSKGAIQINGTLTPFIELGVGFNPELTGRENIYLNGALLGFGRQEMQAMYEDIVEFAELGRFMDQKLKNYSSGMQVRLAFSIAIRAQSDILLIDEVLAVGDQSFQEKCFNYFSQVKKSGKTVIFVTHDMSNVERFCDRVLILDKSQKENGIYSVRDAVSIYNKLNHDVSTYGVGTRPRNRQAAIKDVKLLDSKNRETNSFQQGEALKVKIYINHNREDPTTPIVIGLAFYDEDGNNLAGPNSSNIPVTLASKSIEYEISDLPFNMGRYYLTVALFDERITKQYDLIDKGVELFVNTDGVKYGKFVLDGRWTL